MNLTAATEPSPTATAMLSRDLHGVRDVTLSQWRAPWPGGLRPETRMELEASGVPWAAAEAFRTNLVARGVNVRPGTLAAGLARNLGWWGAPHPAMSLHAGIGWELADMGAAPWIAAGLAETGWLYAAAGLSAPEALQMLASTAPTPEAELRMLAALRGICLLG